jgi:hypothetical protein
MSGIKRQAHLERCATAVKEVTADGDRVPSKTVFGLREIRLFDTLRCPIFGAGGGLSWL